MLAKWNKIGVKEECDEALQTPLIVHISGASGSGKTHLGELLRFTNDPELMRIKDTDEFFEHGTKETEELEGIEDFDEYTRKWLEIRDNEVNKFIAENNTVRVIVFVGLLDHLGPSCGLKPIEYALRQATKRFFIKIDSDVLLRQYYTRVVQYADANPNLWREIVEGVDRISSSDEKMRENSDLAALHVALGYELVPASDIPIYFTALLHRSTIRLLATGYLAGTLIDIRLKLLSRNQLLIINGLTRKQMQLNVPDAYAIWEIANRYFVDGAFHRYGDSDKPSEGDQGTIRILYGKKYAAHLRDVPLLVAYFRSFDPDNVTLRTMTNQ